MRRRSFFEDVMTMPWPVGVGFALVVFFLVHIVQILASQSEMTMAIMPAFRMLAYVFIALLLFASFLSFLTQMIRSKRFRVTRSMADIRSLTWRQFESFVGELFREQGYFVLEAPEGPDNGVDLVLRKHGEKTYVQCKHWKANTVGVNKVRELLGSMTAGGAQAGVFVTVGDYTKAARDFARESGIALIDGEELGRQFGDLENQLDAAVDPPAPVERALCPNCDKPMVKRVAKRGRNKGNSFWGCSDYPSCRGTRPI
jgi:restriction system protein